MNLKQLFLFFITIFIIYATFCLPASATSDENIESNEPYRIIVKYKDKLATNRAASVISSTMDVNVTKSKPMAGGSVVLTLDKDRINALSQLANKKPQQKIASILESLNADPSIEYAVIDRKVHSYVLAQAKHREQWSEFAPPAGVDLRTAFAVTKGNPTVIVAVIDSGIVPHPDLNKNILPGFRFISPYMPDATDTGKGTGFHGTHVAGIIAANGNLIGMAPNIKILPLRALGDEGEGYDSDIINAMYWAAGDSVPNTPQNQHKAKVINLSLGGEEHCHSPSAWQDVINRMRVLNITVVVAAGNENNDSYYSTPSSCQGVITVAATTKKGSRANYSNYGKTVHIAAPGGQETLTDATGGIISTVKGGYDYYQGTSMAAPHIAGIVALLYSIRPSLTPDQALKTLQQSATPFPHQLGPFSCTGTYSCGAGIVNAGNAVNLVKVMGDSASNLN